MAKKKYITFSYVGKRCIFLHHFYNYRFSGTPPACHKWLPLFEETKLYDNIYGWFKILQEQDIKTVGYVLMRSAAQPNHLHCNLPKEAPELYGDAQSKL